MVCIRLVIRVERWLNFSDTFSPKEENVLKLNLTYLNSTKYNKIKISHSHIQKQVSY